MRFWIFYRKGAIQIINVIVIVIVKAVIVFANVSSPGNEFFQSIFFFVWEIQYGRKDSRLFQQTIEHDAYWIRNTL